MLRLDQSVPSTKLTSFVPSTQIAPVALSLLFTVKLVPAAERNVVSFVPVTLIVTFWKLLSKSTIKLFLIVTDVKVSSPLVRLYLLFEFLVR